MVCRHVLRFRDVAQRGNVASLVPCDLIVAEVGYDDF